MPSPIWMPLYIGDYLGETMHLTAAEHGGYGLLRMAYWKNGGPLPYDERDLKERAKLTRKREHNSFQKVLALFTISDGMIRHNRIDKELQIAENNKESRRRAGIIGAEARWQTHSDRIVLPMAHDGSSSSSSSSPSEKKEKKVLRNTSKEKEKNMSPLASPSPTSGTRPDDAFIQSLKENIAYQGIDIDREIGKMQSWLKVPKNKRRLFSHQFMVNWLNKAERPVQFSEAHGTAPLTKPQQLIKENLEATDRFLTRRGVKHEHKN